MSGADVRRTIIMEKTILTEFLQLYQSFPCLWDQKHTMYCNKEAREKAYEVLLEKYKLIQEDAGLTDVKKRIEYMRCAYRREHKKVLIAHIRGEKHIPTLWYYELLTFLNDHRDIKLVEPKCEELQETHEIEDSDDESTPSKRRKLTPYSTNNVVFLSEHNEIEHEEDPQNYHDQDPPAYIINNEPEAFGRTIGFQLKELTHLQRVFAEKLISDVVFQARLGNLSAGTSLNLDSE